MFRKIVTLVIVLPLAAVIVAFAVANRERVTVSFDPFTNVNPAYAATLPLFILIFVLVILGVFVGGVLFSGVGITGGAGNRPRLRT